jgi:hypothetical protein
MHVAYAIIGVAFSAFCVWLTVQVVNRRERWAKRTLTVSLSLPAFYVLSAGPATWLVGLYLRGWVPDWLAKVLLWFYGPLIHLADSGGEPFREAFNWYLKLWM